MKHIPLTQGKFAIVDDEDFEWLSQFNWCYHSGYAKRGVPKEKGSRKIKLITMHGSILSIPEGMEIDHINGNSLDNGKENLRLVTHAQNMLNRNRYRNNKTGYTGVSVIKKRVTKPYFASIQVNYKSIGLGYHDTPEEAALAYNKAAELYHGKYARLNEVKL